jgi:hypothetical protein
MLSVVRTCLNLVFLCTFNFLISATPYLQTHHLGVSLGDLLGDFSLEGSYPPLYSLGGQVYMEVLVGYMP